MTALTAALETPEPPLPSGEPDERAAGVLCWRRSREGGVEVLLVHRPGYDDWSWPKGKPERGEGLAECAVREAAEETGGHVTLGRPLEPVRYLLPDGRLKEASYWTARVVESGPRTAPATEVDDAAWLPLDVAAARLTHRADVAPLDVLGRYAATSTLATTPVLVIRHATARPRDSWARADAERPLVASGRRQAMSLAALLVCWRPDHLVSSPWKRCLATLDPYAAASGHRVRTKDGLSEAGHRRAATKAAKHTRSLLEGTHPAALCTHRPVLGAVLDTVRSYCPPELADRVPAANPYLHPGEVLVAHVRHRPGHRPLVVAIERHDTR